MSYLKLKVYGSAVVYPSFFLPFVLCFMLFVNAGVAQTGKFDAQFAFKQSDCISKKITLQLQVRSHSAANNFLMGDANFRFDYDPRTIAHPKIVLQPHYSILGAQPVNYNYGLQNLNGSSAGPTVGRVSLQCFYTGNSASAEKVDTGWTNVACLQFDLINSDSCLSLKWHTGAPADFPNTGMSEVILLGNGNFNSFNTLPGDFFNFSYGVPNNCNFVMAKNDDYNSPINATQLGNVILNDSSSNTKTVNTTPVASPKHGLVVLQTNGNFSYTPAKDFAGVDSFMYSVCNAQNMRATATAYITVSGTKKSISDDTSTCYTPQDSTSYVCLPMQGVSIGDNLSVNACGAQNGIFTLTLSAIQFCFSYLPKPSFTGRDAVCVNICDSTSSVCNTIKIPIVVIPKSVPTKPVVVSDSSGGRCIDSVPPVVKFISLAYANLKSGDTITANCVNPTIFSANSFSVSDNYDKNPTVSFKDLNRTVGTCLRDGYKILMQCDLIATDSCGNRTDFIFFVKIIDNTPPILGAVPIDITVNDTPPTASTLFATDECGTATVVLSETSILYNCGRILTRTWIATDECGNTTRKSQKITINSGLTASINNIQNETCGGKNGSAQLCFQNAANNYQITSTPNIVWNSTVDSLKLSAVLSAGAYSVTFYSKTDSTCKKIINFSVSNDSSNCCKKYTTVLTIYVTAANCNQNATACTEIPYAQIANYTITDNGIIYKGSISNCNGNAGLSLTVGIHNIVFNQKNLNCADSLFVKVVCPVAPKPSPNSIPLVVNVNESGTWCLSNIPLLHPVKIINLCPSASGLHALVNIDQSTMCVNYKGLKVGIDSACLKIVSSTNDINYVILVFSVKAQPCGNLINPDSVIVNGTCNSNNQVPVCLPVAVSNLQGYTITIDGAPYTIALATCNNNSTQFFVPVGFHKLRFANTAGCIDSVLVGAACVKSETIITELRVGDKDTMCIASNTLLGRKYYLQNLCAKQSVKVNFNLLGGTTCIQRFAKTIGSEKACYILCDEYKLCDTTYMIINVSELKAKPPIAIDDNVKILKNTATNFNVIQNDSFGSFLPTLRIVKYPLNGLITVGTQGEMTYKPSTNYCGADVATYEICTVAGCATANINFKVGCDDLVIYSAFSPNNDGINDYFHIEGIEKFSNSTVSVFNRWGNEVFAAKNYKNDWSGTWGGTNLPEGTYFYVFNDGDGHTLSGYVEIQR